MEPKLRKHIEERLRTLAKAFMLAPLQATVCIGDVHPGNVAVHEGKCTVFDVSTLVASLGPDGKGIAPSADDRVWFAETIPWYARKVKLSDAEGRAAFDAFLGAYRANSPLAADAADAAAVALFRARSAMMDLRFNPDSDEELERALATLGGTPP
jgi:Ser/Thr protein kinase RdoA (MazF antagonist)